jgi:hypothetical protein
MLEPEAVIPPSIRDALAGVPGWFLIGGHAVRCFRPYRPSDDVDLGVPTEKALQTVVAALEKGGHSQVLERTKDTVHLVREGVDVSVFVLPKVARFAEGRRLGVTGILATKLHAILDRGTRRDFFDLYVILRDQRLSITDCFAALRAVYGPDVNESLLLRALAFFDDAEREPPMPQEGPADWGAVKAYFREQVGRLLIPPAEELAIGARVVDVNPPQPSRTTAKSRSRREPLK